MGSTLDLSRQRIISVWCLNFKLELVRVIILVTFKRRGSPRLDSYLVTFELRGLTCSDNYLVTFEGRSGEAQNFELELCFFLTVYINSRSTAPAAVTGSNAGSSSSSSHCSSTSSSSSSLRELVGANERHPEDWRVRKRLGSRRA